MKKVLAVCTILCTLFFVASAVADDMAKETTVNGYVSDSGCGVKGASTEHAACTKKCLEKGAKLDAKDAEGRTPLAWAEGVFLATHPGVPKPSAIELIKGYMTAQNIKTND